MSYGNITIHSHTLPRKKKENISININIQLYRILVVPYLVWNRNKPLRTEIHSESLVFTSWASKNVKKNETPSGTGWLFIWLIGWSFGCLVGWHDSRKLETVQSCAVYQYELLLCTVTHMDGYWLDFIDAKDPVL